MSTPASLRFTYEDYLLLPEDRRYEIIDGDLFMTPAPGTPHQRVVGNLYLRLRQHVDDSGLGEVLIAPCDVVLSPTDVVQPDVLFVAVDRASIVGEKFISAAPDLVVEVLSPSTEERDRTLKTKLYARAGVRELWIADTKEKTIEILTNSGAGFRREGVFGVGTVLRSILLPSLEIPIAEVF
ncbi:MAG TPA: Uma2 family endonuclease [Thermoanaerobaculia bacterium]|nr:Uma2 family endonuclease [Thermoanaerobaculia bacterium]